MKTFVNVFPGASLWGGLTFPGLYLIGGHQSFGQTPESLERLADTLSTIADLSEWEDLYKDRNMLKQLYLLGPGNLSEVVENIPEVTDDRPYTEFPLWRVLIKPKIPLIHASSIRNHLNRLKQVRTD